MWLVSTVGFLLALAAVARPTDHPQEARRFALRSDGARSSLVWVSKLPAPVLPASSPSTVGAKMRVYNQAGESGWLDLPGTVWATYQSGTRFQYVFKNRQAPLGPSTVKLAVLREQQLIGVAARSSGLTLDETSQGTGRVTDGAGGAPR